MRNNEPLIDFADWLSEPPTGGPLKRWGIGICASSLLIGYALMCVATERAMTLNLPLQGMQRFESGLLIEIYRMPAVTFGFVLLFLGLFVHFQWFWGLHPKLWQYHEVGKNLTLVCLILALVAYAFTMITQT